MSDFEMFYLVVGPIAFLTFGGIVFFGGRWMIRRADRRKHSA